MNIFDKSYNINNVGIGWITKVTKMVKLYSLCQRECASQEEDCKSGTTCFVVSTNKMCVCRLQCQPALRHRPLPIQLLSLLASQLVQPAWSCYS